MSLPQSQDLNPYQPPQTAGERPPPYRRTDHRPPVVWAIGLALLGSLAYLGFIVLLVRSIAQDRLAGLIFLGNLTLWTVLAIWEMIRHRVVWRSYSGLIIIQMLIMGGMLVAGFGLPAPVATINLIIIAIAACLGGISYAFAWSYRRRRWSPPQ